MKDPTKADLTAAVTRLTEENRALRDLIAALVEVTYSAPVGAAGTSDRQELGRAWHVLSAIKVHGDLALKKVDRLGISARLVRDVAAEPLDYKPYVAKDEPHPVTFTAAPHPDGVAAWDDDHATVWPARVPATAHTCTELSDAGTNCTSPVTPHPEPHRDSRGYEWGGDEYPPVGLAHHAEPGEHHCEADTPSGTGSVWHCTAQDGHAGNHVAYKPDDTPYFTWPQAVATEAALCESRPFPAGSEGDDGTRCVLPAGHEGSHDDGVDAEFWNQDFSAKPEGDRL